jgi:two-component system OmpR family response regulator
VIKINGMAQDIRLQYKIAVVEDEPSIRNLYQTKLELCGFAVQTASNGLEGLGLVRSFAPDLILLDLLMPEMNGDEMLKQMRAEEWGANVRVIILTNISRSEAPMTLRFLSVDRYVVKAHHTPSQIVEIIYEVLHIKPVN